MKASHLSLTLALAAVASLGAGCAATERTMESNTGRKAAGGAIAGAIVGGIIGNNTGGSTEKGAAIGAVAGGLAGAAVGHQQDKRANSGYDSAQIVVQQPPLAPTSAPYEQVPNRPYPNAVWIPGHYTYNGNTYMWESGRWEQPPQGSTSWIPPAWQPTNGGYVYVRGHWQ